MIGFSMVHNHPALFLFGVASYFAIYLWLVVTLVFVITWRFRVSRFLWAQLSLTLFTLAIDLISTNTWQRGISHLMGPPT